MQNRIVCISRQSDQNPIDFILVQQYVRQHYPDFDVVILAKALRGKISYCFHMVKQVRYLATSKAVLLDSYCIAVSLLDDQIKAPVVQIWHAMGNMKKFGYTALGSSEGRSAETADLLNMHKGYNSILVSSLSFADDFAAGFGVDTSLLYEAPLPKADLLIDGDNRSQQKKAILDAFPQLKEKKNIVYCPTFRKAAPDSESNAMKALLDTVDFDEFNFIYKAHPVSTQRFDDERVLQDYGNYDMLYVADYVISDYSTVIYEAGLLNIPVYLYAYDWDEYQGRRGLNIDLKHDVPTLFTENPQEIMDAIKNDRFDWQAFAQFISNNIAIPAHGTCTERVVEHVFSLIDTQKAPSLYCSDHANQQATNS